MLEGLLQFLSGAAFVAYLLIFVVGLAWVLIGLLLGGLESMADFAHDLAADAGGEPWGHQQVGLSPFSPLMLAVFGMVFGVTGMTLELFTQVHGLVVLLVAAGVAIVLDGGFYMGLYRFFVSSQANSLPDLAEAAGATATVVTRIVPGSTGTINYELAGRRQVAGARSPDGATIEAGEVVRIKSIQGGVAQVTKEN
jgi:hypothetical protein